MRKRSVVLPKRGDVAFSIHFPRFILLRFLVKVQTIPAHFWPVLATGKRGFSHSARFAIWILWKVSERVVRIRRLVPNHFVVVLRQRKEGPQVRMCLRPRVGILQYVLP